MDSTDVLPGYGGAYWIGIGCAAVAFSVVIFVRGHRFDRSKNAKKKCKSGDHTVAEAPGSNASAWVKSQ